MGSLQDSFPSPDVALHFIERARVARSERQRSSVCGRRSAGHCCQMPAGWWAELNCPALLLLLRRTCSGFPCHTHACPRRHAMPHTCAAACYAREEELSFESGGGVEGEAITAASLCLFASREPLTERLQP